MNGFSKSGEVLDNSVTVDGRHHDSSHVTFGKFCLHVVRTGVSVHHRNISKLDSVIFGVCFDDLYHVRKQGLGNEHPSLVLCAGRGHLHGFRRSSRAIVHRSIADVHASQGADHALILEYVPESPLGYFGLVWGVCRQEFRPGSDVRHH